MNAEFKGIENGLKKRSQAFCENLASLSKISDSF